MQIRLLTPADAASFQALRLQALLDVPCAFGSSHEEEAGLALPAIEARLASRPDRGVWGAFQDHQLVGTLGLGRENLRKLSHKAFLWGMYVTPDQRRQGVARALLLQVLQFARSIPALSQINLSVNATSTAAVTLYASAGFTTFGREPQALMIDGQAHEELHMYLRLSPH